ncbi:hypothetical protein OIT44_03890 [Weissella ceti]|uniref:Uncharacterized protein n=1 Tax=Weissella ceti TaxID=759620 RepID=A0ABT3E4C7_9LACO|nr:hypothetical protein [Weissella ceti]MCW0953215.1 hypothetical protein [Weissella ceti]QVK12731.1 hypothetical protein KHQ31_03650 [Weissella ceti]
MLNGQDVEAVEACLDIPKNRRRTDMFYDSEIDSWYVNTTVKSHIKKYLKYITSFESVSVNEEGRVISVSGFMEDINSVNVRRKPDEVNND